MIDTSTRNDNAAPDRSVDTAKAQDAPAPEVATAPASASCASDTPGEVVPIERMSFGSAAVGHLSDGKTVFVEGAVPGDVVRVELTEEKHRFARGHVAEIVEASPGRVTPPCAAGCGGCPWAPLSYEAQLIAKRANVVDALVRTAHMDAARAEALVAPCVPSKRQWGYRNKLELSCGADGAGRLILGLRPEGGADVVSLDACPLAHRNIEGAPKALRGALRYLSGGQDLGLFRVGVRGSLRTRDVEIALWTTPGPFPRAAAAKTLASALKNTSVVRVVADPGRARKVKKVEAISGKGCWEEEVAGSRLLLSAPSFAQVNTAQAEKLVELVLAGLEVDAGDYVADLYAGAGTFTLPLAALRAWLPSAPATRATPSRRSSPPTRTTPTRTARSPWPAPWIPTPPVRSSTCAWVPSTTWTPAIPCSARPSRARTSSASCAPAMSSSPSSSRTPRSSFAPRRARRAVSGPVSPRPNPRPARRPPNV